MIDVVSGCAPPVIGVRVVSRTGGGKNGIVFRKECKVRLWPIRMLKNKTSTK